jgi:curved DNA-binding protein CbpA
LLSLEVNLASGRHLLEPMTNAPNYYRILNISKYASRTDIKKAFRRLAREFHPDLNPNNLEAAAKFKQISEAYEVLGDPERRSHYDTRFENTAAQQEPATTQSYAALYQQAQDKLLRREYQDAIQDFTQAIALSPQSIEAYLGRCKAYDGLKANQAVLDDCFQILQRDPKSTQAYLYQGQARLRLGYPQSAIDAYTQAIALEDTLAVAYVRRAQARLELQDTALAYPDLKKAQGLYRAQQNWTQVQQVERLVLGLKRPKSFENATSFNTESFGSRPSTQSYWALAFGSIPRLVFNPSDNLLPTFAKLTSVSAGWTGLLYGLMAVVCLLMANAAPQSTPLGYVSEVLWKLGVNGCAAYLGLAVASAIARLLMGGRGSLAGDLYLAGVAALPMAVLVLGSSIASTFGIVWEILKITTGCYTVLILYIGCTQINNIGEPKAMFAVPSMIFASFSAWALVARLI